MNQIVKYDVTDVAIAEMSKRYMPLTVKDLDDKEGFEAVHDARMVVKGKRVEVEKARKAYKADALEYGRKVDAEAKRVFALLEPIETHLQTEEDKVTKEKERIKAEEERKEKEKIQGRVDALLAVNVVLPFMDVATMTDEEFAVLLASAKETHEIALREMKEADDARVAEANRVAAERAENDRIREEQETKAKALQEKEDALKAKEKALEAEQQAEIDRKAREKFEKETADNARMQAEKDAKEKAEREAREKKEAEEAEIAEKARQEALKPDKEKLITFAETVRGLAANNLDVKSDMAREIFHEALDGIMKISKRIKDQAEILLSSQIKIHPTLRRECNDRH